MAISRPWGCEVAEEVRSILTQDVLASLRDMRAKLLKAWDG
jgi:hypothetical protein